MGEGRTTRRDCIPWPNSLVYNNFYSRYNFQYLIINVSSHHSWKCMELSKYPWRALHLSSSVGFIFLALPIWSLGVFFRFFLLNLGSTAPNFLGGPLWEQVRPHPIKKIGVKFYPTPSEPSLRAWQVLRSSGVFRHFLWWMGIDAFVHITLVVPYLVWATICTSVQVHL